MQCFCSSAGPVVSILVAVLSISTHTAPWKSYLIPQRQDHLSKERKEPRWLASLVQLNNNLNIVIWLDCQLLL